MPDQPAILAQFRTKYGRLCVLTAKAIKQQHPKEKVAKAAQGKGWDISPVYTILRSQRAAVAAHLQMCAYGGMTISEISDVCYEIRTVVEEEWMLTLPPFAETP